MDNDRQHLSSSLASDQAIVFTNSGSRIARRGTARNSADAPTEAPTQKSAASVIGTVLKLVGLAGAVSTVMGLPAVYLHFKRLGIPTCYIDYNQVLSAGILPVVVVAAVALYFWGVLRQLRRRHGSHELSRLASVWMLFALPSFPILAIAMFAFPVLYIWVLLWLVTSPFRWWGVLNPSNRELLYIAVLLVGIISTGYLFRERLKRLQLVLWLLSRFRKLAPVSPAAGRKPSSPPDQERPRHSTQQNQAQGSERAKTQEQSARKWLSLLPFIWPGMPTFFVAGLFAGKAVVYLWEPSLSRTLPISTILWVGIGVGFGYGLMMSAVASTEFFYCKSRRFKNMGLAILMSSVLLSTGFFITLYSTKVYPALSQGLGGGRLERVTVWIDRKNLPSVEEIRRRLPSTDVTVEGEVVRVQSTLVVRAGKETILIGSQSTKKGLAVPNENLKVVAWTQQ